LFLILSHNNKKSFLRVAVKKLTATIQIFYLKPCLSRSARSPAFRSSLRSSLTENSSLRKKIFPFNQLYFLKSRLRSAIKTGESHPEGLGLDGLTEQSAKL